MTAITASLKKNYWNFLGWVKRPRRFPEVFGEVFNSQYNFLQQSQYWSEDKILQWQNEKFVHLVKLAYENTKFYRELYDRFRLKPADVKSLEDIHKLPVINKADINRCGHEMVNLSIPQTELFKNTTSGSTGQPSTLWRLAKHDMYVDWAFMFRQWNQAGWRWGDRVLRLRGLVGKDDLGDQIRVKEILPEKVLAVSAADMSPANYKKILDILHDHKPDFLEMYPSSLRCLCSLIKTNGDTGTICQPKAIFCESEIITPTDRQLAREVLRCEITGGYGNTERSVDAVECSAHNGYHVNYEYGLVELLDNDNQSVTGENIQGNIVTTGLLTDAMPLIRFDTADTGTWKLSGCECGRKGQMLASITGRKQDFLITADNRIISIGAINHMMNMDWIAQYQLRQNKPGLLEFAYTPTDNRKNNVDKLNVELVKMFRGNMEINFREVKFFELTKSGKHRLVVQNMDIEPFLSGAVGL